MMNLLTVFYFSGHFCDFARSGFRIVNPDPDTDPGTPYYPDQNPDPHHCWTGRKQSVKHPAVGSCSPQHCQVLTFKYQSVNHPPKSTAGSCSPNIQTQSVNHLTTYCMSTIAWGYRIPTAMKLTISQSSSQTHCRGPATHNIARYWKVKHQ